MEHLPLPTDAVLTDDELVPYVAYEDYQGIPFKSYPQLKGFDHAIPKPHQHSFGLHEDFHPTPVDQLERFLQTWLFFGLLQDVLGELFRHEDFVRTIARGSSYERVLSTAKLSRLLEERFSEHRVDSPESATLRDHLAECIVLCSGASIFPAEFNLKIAFSLVVLTESLASTFDARLGADRRYTTGSMRSMSRTHWIQKMRLNGWCPNEAAVACEQLRSALCVHFLSKIKKTSAGRRHDACSEQKCSALQIDLATYEAKHRNSDCNCDVISVDTARLDLILESGKFPLLDFQTDLVSGALKVNFVESAGNRPYVALSHVWADGLGNPHANSLPRCQLLDLRDLADEVFKAGRLKDQEPELPLLWLDTLCCPAAPGRGKSIAIGLMRHTYRAATHVLVLDNTLRCYSYKDMGVLEAAVRIFTSPWMRRLWCLQEGALPERLWFQFLDGCVEISTIFEGLRNLAKCGEPCSRSFVFDLATLYIALRTIFHSHDNLKPDFNTIMHAVSHRSVSVASDELLCLGALFGLDVEVLASTEHGRSARMWSSLCESKHVPSSIIFLKGPKLEERGYRWAPETCLGPRKWADNDSAYDRIPASLLQQGLLVQFPGIILSTPAYIDVMPSKLSESTNPGVLWLRDEDSKVWYQLGHQEKLPASSPQSSIYNTLLRKDTICAMIFTDMPKLLRADTAPKAANTIFVTGTRGEDGVFYTQSKCFVIMSAWNSQVCSMIEKAREVAQTLQQDPITEELAKFKDMAKELTDPVYCTVFLSYSARRKSASAEALRDPVLQAAVHENFAGNGPAWFDANVIKMYRNRYAVISKWLPGDTKWCVD
ncbi:hypothetical protein MMC18_001645 [Xylographa bjoerkii]|nr:hypothetical protein [Xylographa bjoerkii]